MYHKYMLAASLLRAIANTLEQKGYDSRHIIDPYVTEPGATLGGNVISNASLTQIWQDCIRVTRDQTFALIVGENVFPSMLGSLGHRFTLSRTLREAFSYATRESRIVTTTGVGLFSEGQDESEFIFTDGSGEKLISNESFDAFMTICVNLPKRFMGIPVTLKRTHFGRPKPENDAHYRRIFGENLVFNSSKNALVFDNRCLDRVSPNYDEYLIELFNRTLLPSRALDERTYLKDKVFYLVHNFIAEGKLNQQAVASQLNMSISNLQRKLKKEGTSYIEIAEDVKKSMAKLLIERREDSFKSIAIKLGFQSTSNFTRAFKAWYDMTPSQYRKACPSLEDQLKNELN